MKDLFKLLDCVPTPVFVMDVKAANVPVYAHYNAAALARVERPLSDFLGRSTVDVFGPKYGEDAFLQQRKTIESREQHVYEFELPIDNELRIVRTTLCPQIGKSGRVTRLIGSSQDVSAEWIASRAQTKLEALGSEVEQFVAMAAHDLRTPMRNVAMLAEMLREDFHDQGDGKIELIDQLEETSQTSMALITDVLSHASALSAQGSRKLFDLADLVRDVMRVLDPQSNHAMTCTQLSLVGETPAVQIILRNLIENAIKHSQRDNLNLTCMARALSSDWVEITIADDGAGFENPGIIFLETGKFRVDSGYGLLGVRRLITARGGTIRASNCEKTGGSSVRFTLPMHSFISQRNGGPLLRIAG